VFLGYSSRYKGVKYLDVDTGRVYISRDVVFDENIFPFASLNPNVGHHLREEILLLPSDSLSSDHMIGVCTLMIIICKFFLLLTLNSCRRAYH
jgi:hypothetical protein